LIVVKEVGHATAIFDETLKPVAYNVIVAS